ncbi:TPA: hypothetical protein ACKP49_000478 [Stenotrophomonas maltophilia]
MDYPDLASLEEISGPFALLSKGPKFIAAWLAKRTEERYREFTRAALEGQVFPENAEAMTSEDFLAMLRALEMDIEAEKATVYGRLACSIATGKTAGHLKRHFIKALSDLSFGQVDLLRRAWIAERHQIFPGRGGGNLNPKEFLGLHGKPGFNRQTFERWALIDEKGLSLMGRKFVEACFAGEELQPSAVGFQEWAKGQIHIVCNEMDTPACYDFLLKLDEVGHARAIHVHHGAAVRGRSNRPLTPGPVMVVLLTDKPQRLADEWTTVEDTIRGRVLAVVATTDPNAPLPAAMTGLERIDASPDRAAEAVTAILERFEAKGLRGT